MRHRRRVLMVPDVPRGSTRYRSTCILMLNPILQIYSTNVVRGELTHQKTDISPPEKPWTELPSIEIRTGGVFINGPSVILYSPQGMLCTLETEWLSSHGSPPP